jgi:prephenate dehydratase
LEAHRKDDQPNIYRMRVRLLTPDRPGVLLQILKIFDFLGINLADIHTEHSEPGSTYVLCDLEFENPSKIAYLLQDLKMRRDLLKIEEKKIF